MELPLSLQGDQFLRSAVLGLIYGLQYDILRVFRRKIPFLTHIFDLTFALSFLFGNFLSALLWGNGQFRIFMFLALTIGMIVWFLLCSRLFTKILEKFLWVLNTPFRLLSAFFKKILKKI